MSLDREHDWQCSWCGKVIPNIVITFDAGFTHSSQEFPRVAMGCVYGDCLHYCSQSDCQYESLRYEKRKKGVILR